MCCAYSSDTGSEDTLAHLAAVGDHGHRSGGVRVPLIDGLGAPLPKTGGLLGGHGAAGGEGGGGRRGGEGEGR